jgi:hypothetical protein
MLAYWSGLSSEYANVFSCIKESTMLRTTSILILFFAAFAANPNPAQVRPPRISMKLKSEKATVKTGEAVVVKIEFKNITDHDVTMSWTGPYNDFGLIVLDAGGKPVPDTELGRQMRHKGSVVISDGMNIQITLKPNESRETGSISVSNLREMTRSGKYSVQMTGDMGKFMVGSDTGVLKSNRITVTVTE